MISDTVNKACLRGYKIKVYPNEEQCLRIDRVMHLYRAVYNIALNMQIENRDAGNKYLSYYTMCGIFKNMRNENPDYRWMNNISMSSIRQSLVDLNNSFNMFFDGINRFPKFKSRKRSKKSIGLRSERVYIRDQFIGIPDIGNVFAKHHPIPINARVYCSRLSTDGYGNYWFSCEIEREMVDMSCVPKTDPVGIDVGIRNMITTSDGKYYHYSDVSKYEKRIRRQSKRLSKHYNKILIESKRTKTKYDDIPKSKNMRKLEYARNKTHKKISNKLTNDIHSATKDIVNKNPSAIVIENVRVRKILKVPRMRVYAPYLRFYEIRRQLEYKAADRGIPVIVADEHYPSSQICSRCGNIRNIGSSHIYKCPICELKIDRDLNAAYNLRILAYQNANSTYEIA